MSVRYLVLAALLATAVLTACAPDHLPGMPAPLSPMSSSMPSARTTSTPPSAAAAESAEAVLARLVVKPLALARGYSRAAFGPAWADTDHNRCDQRNDVLHRDLTAVRLTTGSRCLVASGVLHDPYTDTTVSFMRGPKTSDAVQIDHVVALDDAWQTGAATWTSAKREQLATDEQHELLAVNGPTNQAKGDADAASWLPPNTHFGCPYVAAQIRVKATYGLWVTPSEHEAMARILATCPGQQLPTTAP
jgi:hypothetical protein